jgi:hypothetical protein
MSHPMFDSSKSFARKIGRRNSAIKRSTRARRTDRQETRRPRLEPLEGRLPLAAFVPGELLVGFRANFGGGDDLRSFYSEHGLGELANLNWRSGDGDAGLRRLSVPQEWMETAIRILKSDPRVDYVEPNYIHTAAALPTPLDPRFGELWGARAAVSTTPTSMRPRPGT